jgi:aspartyl protease family protein
VVQELRRAGAVSPGNRGRGAVVKVRKTQGHFMAGAKVNGRHVYMIVDTGASTVVLRSEDARRAGIELRKLDYTVPVETANGRAYAARVKLDKVSLGELTLEKVDALVTKPGALHQSLLGMSFLSRLRSYEFTGNQLVMRS